MHKKNIYLILLMIASFFAFIGLMFIPMTIFSSLGVVLSAFVLVFSFYKYYRLKKEEALKK